MSDDDVVDLTIEEAEALLDINDGRVHSFAQGGTMLIGADWDLEDVLTRFRDHGAELSGAIATGMGHGVASRGGGRALFFATKRDSA